MITQTRRRLIVAISLIILTIVLLVNWVFVFKSAETSTAIKPGRQQKERHTKLDSAVDLAAAVVHGDFQGLHRVHVGDTLSAISRKYGISTRALLEANRNVSGVNIQVGDLLVIPAKVARVSTNSSSATQ